MPEEGPERQDVEGETGAPDGPAPLEAPPPEAPPPEAPPPGVPPGASAPGARPDEESLPGESPDDAGSPGLPPDEATEDGGAPDRRSWRERVRLAGLVLFALLVVWLLITWITWPDVASLRTRNPDTTAFIERYREARRAAGMSDDVAWQPVPYERISANLKRAVVASEDTEFFFHDGFSSHEMREALKKALREREAPRGASTITQQLAKNLWLTPRRNLTRKLREALLTRQLERELSKQRILELYLNVVEFGPGIYGAEAAARHYFGIAASDLSARQGAMLAAGLPRPARWNPSSASEYYTRRVQRILSVERQLQYLDRYFGPERPGSVEVAPPQVRADSERPDTGELLLPLPADSSPDGGPAEAPGGAPAVDSGEVPAVDSVESAATRPAARDSTPTG